jgi:hypothetical protein
MPLEHLQHRLRTQVPFRVYRTAYLTQVLREHLAPRPRGWPQYPRPPTATQSDDTDHRRFGRLRDRALSTGASGGLREGAKKQLSVTVWKLMKPAGLKTTENSEELPWIGPKSVEGRDLQTWAKTLRCRPPSLQGSVYLTDR